MIRSGRFNFGFWGMTILTPVVLGMSGCIVQEGPPAQEPVYSQPAYVPPPAYAPQQAPAPAVDSDDAQLQELVAPIALYPDPLLAVLLPAATFPDQIQAAAAWQQGNPNAPDYAIGQQAWDPTVQAMVHYPSVLQYMNGNIQWTQSLGSAFSQDQGSVMTAIQELRAQAYANGSLVSTPQMAVFVEGSTIYCQPGDPNDIWVPTYDPVYVYQQRQVITFGPQFVVGVWLTNGVDWDHRNVYQGDWHDGWQAQGNGWQRDPNWRPAEQHAWVRDQRYGAPPRVQPAQYAEPQEVRAHVQDFKPAPPVRSGPIAPQGKAVGFNYQHQQAPTQEPKAPKRENPVSPQQQRPAPAQGQNQEYQGKPVLNPQEGEHQEPNAPGARNGQEEKPAPKQTGTGGQGAAKSPDKTQEKKPEEKPEQKSDQKSDQDQGQGNGPDQSKMPQR